MKLRELYEDKSQTVGIIFGRFNPPHMGHKAAWDMASKNDQWFVGTNQTTQGPKDPLPADVKVSAMEAIMPEIKGHAVFSKSWLTLANEVYQKYPDATLKIYTDEEWVPKLIYEYNGKEGSHGFYDFKNIDLIKTPRLSSATDLRAAVANNNRQAFANAAGVPADTPINTRDGTIGFFDLVEKYLNGYRRS